MKRKEERMQSWQDFISLAALLSKSLNHAPSQPDRAKCSSWIDSTLPVCKSALYLLSNRAIWKYTIILSQSLSGGNLWGKQNPILLELSTGGVCFTAPPPAAGFQLLPNTRTTVESQPLQTFSFSARVSHDEDFYMRIPLPCFELVYFPQLSHLTKRKE